MNKLKVIIFIETLVIIALALFIFLNDFKSNKKDCMSYVNSDNTVCLLSPRIYTDIIPPQSYLILNFEPLKQDLQSYIRTKNQNISIYILNMRDGASIGINENQEYEPVSLNKLPVAVLIMKKVEAGKLSLDTPLEIKETDRDKTSGTLYSQPFKQLTVRELLHYMLSESDNTAFWVLQRQITRQEFDHLIEYLGYYDDLNYNSEFNIQANITQHYKVTPKTTSSIFSSLYLSTILNPEDSEMILLFLTHTTFDIHKHSGIPENVVIAQKYGYRDLDNLKVFHSCGIMYIQDSRIFYCIMTNGLDWDTASESIGTISNKTYNFVINQKGLKNAGIDL